VKALLRPVIALSAWAQPATVEACTNSEVVAVASVRFSAWAQLATVLAGTTGEVVSLANLPSVGVCSANNCGGGHDS
jgi:hypothetical protein